MKENDMCPDARSISLRFEKLPGMDDAALFGKTMTVKEVADVLQIPEQTIRNNVRVLFPELMRNGVTTYLNEKQVTALKLEIERHHNLSSTG
jgi:transcription initiation factor TFIIIB Brf1 subunit/transcription initiation factor TFIIB